MKTTYANVREVADEFDAFIVDVWGVLHDGKTPYPGAANCLKELSRRGKTVLLLSNTPSTTAVLIAELAALGFDPGDYTTILASGEVTRALLLERFGGSAPSKPGYLYVGPEERRNLLDDTGYIPIEDVEEAGFVLVTGLNDGVRDLDSYDDFLASLHRRRLPIYCASPDKTITTQQGEIMVCAGSLAERYERMGGSVTWVGKPHPLVYQEVLARLGTVDRRRTIAIGDGLETDIAGAKGAGLSALLLAGGIAVVGAGGATPEHLWAYCAKKAVMPDGILERFIWE